MAKGRDPAANLVPNAERTPDELRAMAKKGGLKSGEVRKRKKATKELMRAMLSMKARTTGSMRKKLLKAGYDLNELGEPTVELMMQVAIADKAMDGDIASARFIYDYALVPDMRTQLERERLKAAKKAVKGVPLTDDPLEKLLDGLDAEAEAAT